MVQSNIVATAAAGLGAFNTVTNYNQQEYLNEQQDSIDTLKFSLSSLSTSEATDISELECKIDLILKLNCNLQDKLIHFII